MTQNQYQFRGLERLASEHGLDVRATVLRVATDLFCQTRLHSPADIARYTDLALALLEYVDADTRKAVAQKLAQAPHAPERLLRQLLDDDDVTVTGAILSESKALSRENLSGFLSECGPAEAAAIARRNDIDLQTIRLLAGHSHLLVVETLIENAALHFDPATVRLLVDRLRDRPALARLLLARPDISPEQLTPLYLEALPDMRARMRDALEARLPHASPSVPLDAVSDLNDAVIAAEPERVGASLGKALRLDPAGVSRILNDPTGEVFVLALAAAGIKRAPAVRLLLIAAVPEVRMSVELIHAAADIHESTSRRVAREIVAAVAGERRTTAGAFEPHMHPSSTPQRVFGQRRRPLPLQKPMRRTDIVGR